MIGDFSDIEISRQSAWSLKINQMTAVGIYALQRGRFTFVDQKTADMLGYQRPEQVIGLPFWPMVYAEDHPLVRISCATQRAGRRTVDTAFRMLTRSGRAIPVRMHGANMVIHGRPANVGCIVDLSALENVRFAVVGHQRFSAPMGQGEVAGIVENGRQKGAHRLIGESALMQTVGHQITVLAPASRAVLITGERGTGKTLVARLLHQRGGRAHRPPLVVNCAVFSGRLLESELFGHTKGAYAGVTTDRAGCIEAADGGTILLDEISGISSRVQRGLLRVLQDRKVQRVGDSVSRTVDAHVIALTRKDLKTAVRQGTFREDLYRLLQRGAIGLPPLRQRMTDLPQLIDHFCERYSDQYGRRISGVSPQVLDQFTRYRWPGNVGELEQVLLRAFLLYRGRTITMVQLPPHIMRPGITPQITIIDTRLEQNEEAHNIIAALNRVRWNKTKAAELLGISRQTLYRKLKIYNIWERIEQR